MGLPVFNGAKYLASSLNCLLHQDYEDLEVIISDNASTDDTESICHEYAAKDDRIRYFRNESNIGASANYNRVFRLARGEFFKWASHDDEFDSSLLSRCLEVFDQASTSTVLVFPKAEIIDENGRVMFQPPDRIDSSSERPFKRLARVLWSSSWGHALWGLIRSDALRRTRLMGCIEADHVLLGELALLGRLVEISEVLYRLRCHPGSAIPTYPSARALLAWHDPKRADAVIFLPYWERVYVEHIKGIRHKPLSPVELLLCLCAVPSVGYWRRFLRFSSPVRRRLGLHRKRSKQELDRVSL